MKPEHSLPFFKRTLGLKEIPNSTGSTDLVDLDNTNETKPDAENYTADNLDKHNSSSRWATYQLFAACIAQNQAPVFNEAQVKAKIIGQGQLVEEHDINLVFSLLKALELHCLGQAIIDDDRDTVEAMLKQKPELLLMRPRIAITSEYTDQVFAFENFLGIACQRKQIAMVQILLPYFAKLQANEDADVQQQATAIRDLGLAQWLTYKTDATGKIQIPEVYENAITPIITAFEKEPAHGDDHRNLSKATEAALTEFCDKLLPRAAAGDNHSVITKENAWDVELMLLAAYTAYVKHYDNLQTWEGKNAYCIRVIGFIQSVLSPETAKILCEGLCEVAERGAKISDRAAPLKLADGKDFYPVARSSKTGLGFQFLCANIRGASALAEGDRVRSSRPRSLRDITWRRFMEQKQQLFGTYAPAAAITPAHSKS